MQQQHISNNDRLITPAAYARSRNLNRSTICRQIQRGKIPTHDGLILPTEADQARHSNLHLSRGRRKPDNTSNTEASGNWVGAEWLDTIRRRAVEILPELARRLGLPEHIAGSAGDIFDSLLAYCGADPTYFEDGDDYTWPAVEVAGVAPLSPEDEIQADEFLARLWKALDQLVPAKKG